MKERNNKQEVVSIVNPFNKHKIVTNNNKTYKKQWALFNPLANKFTSTNESTDRDS